jgi:hypothetical protein
MFGWNPGLVAVRQIDPTSHREALKTDGLDVNQTSLHECMMAEIFCPYACGGIQPNKPHAYSA